MKREGRKGRKEGKGRKGEGRKGKERKREGRKEKKRKEKGRRGRGGEGRSCFILSMEFNIFPENWSTIYSIQYIVM